MGVLPFRQGMMDTTDWPYNSKLNSEWSNQTWSGITFFSSYAFWGGKLCDGWKVSFQIELELTQNLEFWTSYRTNLELHQL